MVIRNTVRAALAAGVVAAVLATGAAPAAAVAADGASCMGQAASEGATALGGLGTIASGIAGPAVGVEVISPNARTRGGGHCGFEAGQ